MYDCYFTNVLTQRSALKFSFVGLDSWVTMFHSRRCSYIRTDDPSTKTGVHSELEHRGLRSQQFCERCGYLFFFTRRPRQQFPLPANLHRHSRHTHFQQDETSFLLGRKAVKRTDRTSLCCIWEQPQRCFPPFGQEPREA